MCNPMMVFMAVTTVASYAQQRQAQKAQVEAQEKQAKAAVKNANLQQQDLIAQAQQENQAVQEEVFEQNIAAAEAQAAARSSAAEGGVEGAGVNRLVAQIGGQESRNLGATLRNLRGSQLQRQAQSEGIQSNLEGTLNQLRAPVDGPSGLDLALNLGSSIMSGQAMGNQIGVTDFSSLGKSVGNLFNAPQEVDPFGAANLDPSNLGKRVPTRAKRFTGSA